MINPKERKKIKDILQERINPDMVIESKFQTKDLMAEFQSSVNRKLELFEAPEVNNMIKTDEFNGIRIPIRGKSQVKYANQELRMVQEAKNSFNNFITEMYPDLNLPRKKINH
ncbi:MAG: hypothetical protein ISS48_00780 [Candidatus Aenigmarchaeota archaeon]|nr:hypothetical protein [Candidatus Aenigmarchaeota archaeon]